MFKNDVNKKPKRHPRCGIVNSLQITKPQEETSHEQIITGKPPMTTKIQVFKRTPGFSCLKAMTDFDTKCTLLKFFVKWYGKN